MLYNEVVPNNLNSTDAESVLSVCLHNTLRESNDTALRSICSSWSSDPVKTFSVKSVQTVSVVL